MPVYTQRSQVTEAFGSGLGRTVIRHLIEDYLIGEQCHEYMQEHGSDEGFTPSAVSENDIAELENQLYELRAVEVENRVDLTVVRKMLLPRAEAEVIDENIDEYVSLFPAWKIGEDVKNKADSPTGKEDRRQHNGVVWKCMVSHTTQVDWEPGIAGTLWSRVAVVDPGTGYEVWKAWDGHNESLYQEGNIVWYPTIDTTLYIATLGNNHWRPDSGTGWQVYVPV